MEEHPAHVKPEEDVKHAEVVKESKHAEAVKESKHADAVKEGKHGDVAKEVKHGEATKEVVHEEAVPVKGHVEHAEKIEEEHVPDVAENEFVNEMEDFLRTDEEGESEAGEEEGEIIEETEEVLGLPDKSEAKVEVELEFVKKKKPEPKIRKVDMDIHYPDESKSSMDEKVVEKKVVEVATEGGSQDLEDSEELLDPTKDYSVVDPSFLDDFFSSEETRYSAVEKRKAEGKTEAFEEAEEEEDDFQQEIYVQPPSREPSDRIYDQICDLETPLSSDESFKVPRFRYIPRRKSYPTQGFKAEDSKWLAQAQSVQSVEVPSTALLNLMENIAPALRKTLLEIATYQPSNAVHFMTHSLLKKAKLSQEIGLEPDPHLIQVLVDGQKKKKKQQQLPIIKKSDEILIAPHAESHISTPQPEVKPDIPISDDDEDPSQLHKFQRKYRKAKKIIVTEEKAKRSNLDRRTFLPGTCLGPTSLPLIMDVPSKKSSVHTKLSGVSKKISLI
ncbi:neurofilament medium polypeptide [Halyomorpha halys]|uniref:neurofilament medium polypeptide n=1 Tax=Halyomorpha halys TaxID=286706 RepID=UPI0006D51DE7|nr:uncharacterized protein LOC106691102 [Halyomorpha halys]